jgi:endonuclease III-like uncharacterized protein
MFSNPNIIIAKNEFSFAMKAIEVQLNFLQEYQLFQKNNISTIATQPLYLCINNELYYKETNAPLIDYFNFDIEERKYRFFKNYYNPALSGTMSKFELYNQKRQYLKILEKIFSQLNDAEKSILGNLLKLKGLQSPFLFKEMFQLLKNYEIL